MNYILLFLLITIFIINYRLHRNILDPSVVVALVFSLSAFFLCANPSWDYVISVDTLIIIVTGVSIFSFFTAMIIDGDRFYLLKKIPLQENYHFVTYSINKTPIFIMTIISVLFCLAYVSYQYRLASMLGGRGGFSNVLTVLRNKGRSYTEENSLGTVLNIGISYCRAIGYISLYLFIQNVASKRKEIFRYIIPILCVVINLVFSGERGSFITFLAVAIFDTYIILVNKNNGQISINHKIIKYGVMAVAIFMVVFWGLATINGSSEIMDAWDTFSIYFGSPILCFDDLLYRGFQPEKVIGSYTFKGIYGILRYAGINVDIVSNNMSMVRWSSFSSNIYTSFSTYYRDFGIIGILIFEIILGLIFGKAWREFNDGKSKILSFTYGRFFGYSAMMFSIAERFFSQYFALNVAAELFIYIIVLILFVKPFCKYLDDK